MVYFILWSPKYPVSTVLQDALEMLPLLFYTLRCILQVPNIFAWNNKGLVLLTYLVTGSMTLGQICFYCNSLWVSILSTWPTLSSDFLISRYISAKCSSFLVCIYSTSIPLRLHSTSLILQCSPNGSCFMFHGDALCPRHGWICRSRSGNNSGMSWCCWIDSAIRSSMAWDTLFISSKLSSSIF